MNRVLKTEQIKKIMKVSVIIEARLVQKTA